MKILPGGGADEGKIGVEQVRWRIWFTFLLLLGMVHYDTLKFCPSMLAASAVYTARCSLKFHTATQNGMLKASSFTSL
ncbi:hypothetical protein Bca52824_026833 [Brassica carinata]|uniref:Cyclin C-terminal domain-containing protein n=1 Tax=Brassica carinata TaxID=52824 RepID=A0A8X7SIE5_BRACI|nr:hypothetical protein Bca52824_026833 [Brassica carinata]